jgi:hypothetical protein
MDGFIIVQGLGFFPQGKFPKVYCMDIDIHLPSLNLKDSFIIYIKIIYILFTV